MITYYPTAPQHDEHMSLLETAHPDWDLSRKERVIHAFSKSSYAAQATIDNQVVAVVRAISDGIGFTLVADLLVDPKYRRQGIASALMKMVLVQYPDCYIYADPGSPEAHLLYQKLGFQERQVYLYRPNE